MTPARPAPTMNFNTNKSLWLWVAVGFLAYLVLPWYAIQEANGLSKIPQVFANDQAGNISGDVIFITIISRQHFRRNLPEVLHQYFTQLN